MGTGDQPEKTISNEALDVLLALNMPQTPRAEAVNCVCAAAASGRQALIEVRGA